MIVFHTWPEADPVIGFEAGWIISAPKATGSERRAYEEGKYQ